MKHIRFNFIDKTFGEKVECLVIWDDEEFIIITSDEEKLKINKYQDVKKLFVEFLTNKNELDFLRKLTDDQEKETEKSKKK